ncbi:Crp/Fnr family transcriptional regulator, partial [Methylobacterium nigriterrae]|uniref:Crp/Fnr family transcriptional regulator n=1 Tax=Methylobacterium nigriterrae TaxID=3127512 RepID=UPI003013BE86
GPPNSVCLILSGIACRYKIWSDGARRIISLIVPGDICDGHLPLPFMLGHTVGALTPCTVADIPRHAMAELIETFPRIAHTLVVPVAGRCARTQRGLEVPLQLLIRTHISLCH